MPDTHTQGLVKKQTLTVAEANAIGLYLSCGFEIKTTYDYYGLIIS
ncbi:MAG TPA: hypothetical protein VFZ02_03595 [Ktedonobacteraceae bacterium]